MTLKSKIIFQTGFLCLILWVGACYLFWGTYRVQQKLGRFTPTIEALVATADVDLALASEQRTIWSALGAGGELTPSMLSNQQQKVLSIFDSLLAAEQRQKKAGGLGEDSSIANVGQLMELYRLWQQRSEVIIAAGSGAQELAESARMLLDDQLFPGLEDRLEHAILEVQTAYADLEEALGFFPWMQAGSRQRVRGINSDLAFVIDGNRVYALLNRQFAVLQAFRVNARQEDLGTFQDLFLMTEDALGRWHRQAVARLRVNGDDRAVAIDLEKVSAVEEGYGLLRDLTGDALMEVPANEARDALERVVQQIENLVQGNLRPTVMASLKSGVKNIRTISTTANQVGVTIFAILFLVVIVQSIRWVRGTLHSLEVLRFGIEAYQSGGLAHRVTLKGNDEFFALGTSLNRMAEQLEASRQEVEDLNSSLERKVEERTVLLEEANNELKAFNLMVSHDLRNPLSAVLGLSEALLEKARQKGNDDEVPLKHIVRAAERIDLTINALLNLSHFGYQPLRYDAIDLCCLARKVVDELPQGSDSMDIVCPPDGSLMLAADPSLMRLVLDNLLQNAVKYADPERPLRVEIGCGEINNDRVFHVRDNGRGFDVEEGDDPFAPFSRLHEKEDVEGKGIGLAVVQRIIQRHGGDVWVESRPGEGTTFFFTIADRRKSKRDG